MRTICLTLGLLAFAVFARGDEAADKPHLVLNTGGHTAPITKILFTPDGKEVVTVSEDKTVRRWDAATGEPLAVLRLPVGPDYQGALFAGALSRDGKTLAVGGSGFPPEENSHLKSVDVHVFLIDLASGGVVATLPGNKLFIQSLAFSHDGKVLAGSDLVGGVYVWDVPTGRLRHMLESHPDAIPFAMMGAARDLAFSPDDTLLAAAYEAPDKTARLWKVKDGKEACPPLQHESGVSCVAWKDNDTLATGGKDFAYISLWDRTGKRLKHFDKLRDRETSITSMTFLPGKDELFYTWSEDKFVLIDKPVCKSGGAVLNLAKPEDSRDGLTWENHQTEVRGAVSPDGALAATSGDDDIGVNLWTLKDGKVQQRLVGRGQTPFWAGWSPDGKAVGWANIKTAAKGKDADALQRSFDLGELRFGKKPDAKFVRAAHARGDLHLTWPPPPPPDGPLEIRDKKGHVSRLASFIPPSCYTFVRNNGIVLGWKGALFLFETHTGKNIRILRAPPATAWDLAPSPDGRYLLAAFSDQTLRIYDPEKEEPLLSLFVAGADWVAWTQEGYYAASPAGERLMGWQVNNGLNQLGAFYPAAQFHKTFYRPDVIRRVLAEGSVEKALAAADKESGQTTAAVDVAQALPPEVAILSPAAGPVDAAEVEVKARAASKDHPVVTMHLLVDGRPAPGAAARTFPNAKAGEKQEATWKVTLPDGEHHLVALAETDASLGASAEVVVTRQAAAQEPLPTMYVLAMGVNAYPGSLKLTWAVEDASKIAEAFQAEAAPKPYGKVETKLLLDKDATKEGILAGLDWLKTKMTADDTAVVFYAGHGHRDRKTSQFYMLPQDVDVSNLPGTGVTGTQLKEKFKAMAGRVLVLLDACHSGSIGDSPADPGSLTDDVQRQLAAPDCGVVILCAAMAQEEAGEAAAVQHGFFTAALLSGLSGGAPRSRDGLIHLTALNFYVEEQVAELSKDEQHVVVDRPATVTSFPLVKPPAQADENSRK